MNRLLSFGLLVSLLLPAPALARYYDPGIGRFLSRDQYPGQSTDVPSLHRYAYVKNNPLRYTDPDGLCWFSSNEGPCRDISLNELLTGGKRPASTTIAPPPPASLSRFDPNLEQYSDAAKFAKTYEQFLNADVPATITDAADRHAWLQNQEGARQMQTMMHVTKEGAKVVVEASYLYLGGEALAVGAGVLAPHLARVGARTVGAEFEGGAIISQAARTERLVGNLAQSRAGSQTSRFLEHVQHEKALAAGTEGAASRTSADAVAGRIKGTPYDPKKLDQLGRYLDRRGIDLRVSDTELPRHLAGAFDYGSTRPAVLLRPNPSQYEVWHEVSHYLHYRKVGSEAYSALPRSKAFNAPEQHVFDFLENNPKRWGALNEEERQHAITYVERVGGFR